MVTPIERALRGAVCVAAAAATLALPVSVPASETSARRLHIIKTPLAYTWHGAADRQPDGSYSYVWFGVDISVATPGGGRLTPAQWRKASGQLSDVRASYVTGLFVGGDARHASTGTCFGVQYHVPANGTRLAAKHADDRAQFTLRVPGFAPLRTTLTLRPGNYEGSTERERRIIHNTGCAAGTDVPKGR